MWHARETRQPYKILVTTITGLRQQEGKVRGKVVTCSLQHNMKAYKGLEVQHHTLLNTGTRWR